MVGAFTHTSYHIILVSLMMFLLLHFVVAAVVVVVVTTLLTLFLANVASSVVFCASHDFIALCELFARQSIACLFIAERMFSHKCV